MGAGLFKAPTKNFWSTSLNGAIDDDDTTITLNSATNLQYPGYLVINREDSSGTATSTAREVIKFTGIDGSDITGVTRAADNSTARSHADGSLVEAVYAIGMHNDQRDAIDAEHTVAGAHTTDVIAEKTAATGVTVDGLLIKDSVAVYGDNAPNITPKARAYRETAQDNLEGVSKIEFDTESYDIGGDFDMGTLVSGTADGNTVDHLIDSGGDFVNDGVVAGDRVKNTTDNTYGYVTAVAAGDLTLNDDIFPDGNEGYEIKKARFVAPVTGYYHISTSVSLTNCTADTRHVLYVRVNNVEIMRNDVHTGTGLTDLTLGVTDIYHLTAGQYVEVLIHVIGNATTDITHTLVTFLTVHLIST